MRFFGCSLDENVSGESMALKVVNNSRIKFLYRKK